MAGEFWNSVIGMTTDPLNQLFQDIGERWGFTDQAYQPQNLPYYGDQGNQFGAMDFGDTALTANPFLSSWAALSPSGKTMASPVGGRNIFAEARRAQGTAQTPQAAAAPYNPFAAARTAEAAVAATPAMASPVAAGEIDNSSREAFFRTAYPYMLQAAGGNKDAAEMMLAAAVSENGAVGSGGGFSGNNFFGIKGTGPAGSFTAPTWEQVNGQRVNQDGTFRAYNNPVEGFQGFFNFLRENSRYAQALQQYDQTGDAAQLFQGINAAGYATDTSWANTIASIRDTQVRPVTSQLPQEAVVRASAAEAQQAGTVVKPLRGITTAQYGSESMATGASDYICGPIAAQAFLRAAGRNPTLAEALQMARGQGLISAQDGMAGIDSTATLIRSMGGKATVDNSASQQETLGELVAGRPVIINTPNHYFVAEDYDPKTGRFDFSESVKALGSHTRTRGAGGSTWYTLEEIGQLGPGYQVRGAIYAR